MKVVPHPDSFGQGNKFLNQWFTKTNSLPYSSLLSHEDFAQKKPHASDATFAQVFIVIDN